MKQLKVKNRRNLVFFKRWLNKNYAIFCSLKKEIIILTLPVIYLMFFNQISVAQDTINLNQIVIQSPKKGVLFNESLRIVKIISITELERSPSNNLADVLNFAMGVDVRQRGTDEVQADISVRGGTFDQVLILLNGVPISDAQTGHNTFSIPVDVSCVKRIEILQGPGTLLYGLNAFSGAINIITKKDSNFFINAKLIAGQHNTYSGSFSSAFKIGKSNNLFSVSNSQSDGYTLNSDYDISKLYYNSNIKLENYAIFFQLGLISKNFGAYNFYTPNFPFQFEAINNQISSITFDLSKKLNTKINAYYRRNQDKFELFRESENWYVRSGDFFVKDVTDTAKYVQNSFANWAYYRGHNYHVTNSFGVSTNSNFKTKIGLTSFGFDYNQVDILSNVLGLQSDSVSVPFEENVFFTKSAKRSNYSVYIDHYLKIKRFSFSAGLNLNYSDFFKFYYAFGSNLSFNLSKYYKTYISVNQGLRLPTFTDLYYKGPSNIGNEELQPEKSTTFEFGQKYISENISIQAAIFYRFGKNTIDWVKIDANDLWQPMNYTEVNTFGFDFGAKFLTYKIFNSEILKLVDLNYNYLHQDKQKNEYISRYVFDYPVHSFSLNVYHTFFKNLTFNWRINYKMRTGTYTFLNANSGILEELSYPPYWLVDAKISYSYKFATIFIGANNIFDTKYFELSNVVPAGRWIKGGVSVKLQ